MKTYFQSNHAVKDLQSFSQPFISTGDKNPGLLGIGKCVAGNVGIFLKN